MQKSLFWVELRTPCPLPIIITIIPFVPHGTNNKNELNNKFTATITK